MSIILTSSSPIYSPTSSIMMSEALVSSEAILSALSPPGSIYSKPITVSFEYSKPLVSVYETIDTNPEVRAKMLNYYYDVIRDKWLLDELNDFLNYFIYRDGKVTMVKNLSDYSPNNISKDTDQIAEEKVKYINKNIFGRKKLAKLISKFTSETGTKWVDLPRNEFLFRKAVKEYLKKLIKRELKGQNGGCDDHDHGDKSGDDKNDGKKFDLESLFRD